MSGFGSFTFGVSPFGAATDTGPPYLSPFFAVEVIAARPGATTLTVELGHGTTPYGALAQLPDEIIATGTLYASDVGYRSAPDDPQGVVAYPPTMIESITLTREVDVAPGQSGAAVAWGTLRLSNEENAYDSHAASWNNDGRGIRILRGFKHYDRTRGYWMDPAYANLVLMFGGIQAPWALSERRLLIPIRDATYWLDRPVQTSLYGGTGTYDGNTALAGTLIPKTRGAAWNVSPVLIDPTNLIYQYTDFAGTVAALWEGGKSTYGYAGNTTNLYAGSVAAGQYRTDNSRGLFQLGTLPTYQITADVTGSFPVSGYQTNLIDIARCLLGEDIGLPSDYLDYTNFMDARALCPQTGGWHFSPLQNPDGIAAVAPILAGAGVKLIPLRSGALGLFVLRALASGAVPIASLDTTNVASVTTRALPASINPPPYRIRAGYKHNHTVQTSGLNPTATAAQMQYVATSDLYGSWSSTDILTSYSRPNDLAPVITALDNEADASALATAWGALWGARRKLIDVTVPIDVGFDIDIGTIVRVRWPADDLINGRVGQVVGDNIQTGDEIITLTVLI